MKRFRSFKKSGNRGRARITRRAAQDRAAVAVLATLGLMTF
jgi:hypothetical protein